MDNAEEFWQAKKRRDEALRALRRRFVQVGDEMLSKAVGNFLNLKSDGYCLSVSKSEPKFIEAIVEKRITAMDRHFKWVR